eukprot:Gregarina_sp_Pseudo_9__2432@NODE_2722_length_897_cov_119_513986_g2492_i0_p1_GENE_NODE_2722_length_897_cov_119_513986_g2492_i0NODE_2722_length_897_cov_119_513986_g2492_i0_p1_ORF_typecomplete_len144_score31_24SRPalpha_N/PF04086_13/0_11_NODE_2722_length_897_cov_119_513986_g2492_i0392823
MSYAQQYSSQRIDESAAESDAAEEAEAGGSLRPQESTNMASPSPSPKSSSRRWNLGGSAEETSLDTSAVTPANLYLWLRRCSRKFNRGVTVIKVLPNGKIVRRQLFIGAKPEVSGAIYVCSDVCSTLNSQARNCSTLPITWET